MVRIVWAFAAIALAGCATGIPARYNHPYKGTMYVAYGDTPTVRTVCRSPRAGACMFHRTNHSCYVLINQRYKSNTGIFNHEQAHCNGWTGAHEQ